MTTYQRTPETCPYKRPDNRDASIRCALLDQLVGEVPVPSDSVDRQMCQACCDSFYPTVDDWNPVIASLVFQRASERLAELHPGAPTCGNVEQIMTKAIEQLPVVLRYENDLIDDLQRHRQPTSIDLAALHRCLPLIPASSQSRATHRWSVVITTSPRRQPTLQICYDSLVASGWSDPAIAIDGVDGVVRPPGSNVIAERANPVGAWPAWIASLRYLVSTDADVVMIVQDDTLFPEIQCLKQYVDQNLWPNDHSIVSLYTSSDDVRPDNRWQPFPRRWALGALAMAFPQRLAHNLLAAIDARQLDFIEGDAGIDTRIGVWAQRHGIEIWHPSPSLVQHIGQVSTVWESSRAVGIRRASRYIADEWRR
ncbi:hypothetical protein [Roseiconus lacunae]|uniref:hypothetical protein n=1 Tax=Roseiconus lacunae TaxID=2605694 RepID=UPI001E6247F9|nr:hypothetical protein [Roseiconus lacunae]MCD0460505.1 hypothetical protein [Roseiconus lacunae]